ncbi:transketolase [Roseateles asaccharophilus]|uniref:Transketolase n=1 Tax=Roseateles asaccharophilus TaxID=582607 RepID=A0ABU2A227_9BURK|nr:transketolase [Roseateles asaccharophilus]MDR7331247.1 transketolase [Roseateles asaccharophilus]
MQHDLTLAANALRMLAIDAVQQANSGHPGMPMGMADLAAVLWSRHLRHNPADPTWPSRDRFVLSNGHGSMLLYGLLHLSGYDLPIEELKAFRQLHSKTPGHPEVGLTPGVETTTGPLGQGLANAVGMALAEQLLASEFNTPEHRVVDHRTFVFCGDGCLMEGISHEACSLAGTWGLGKLVVIYDDNGISIDGHVEGWFNDDTPARFEAYGWRVIRDVDGHDFAAIAAALDTATQDVGKPTLICARTVIGKGSPNKAGGHDVHGAPLGAAEVAAVREALNWPHAPFVVPDTARAPLDARARGAAAQREWEAVVAGLPAERAAEFKRRLRGELPADFATRSAADLAATVAKAETIASRKASQNSINRLAPALPELLGGSADLAPSNLTQWTGCRSVEKAAAGGNYLHYGVREFAMVAIQTGIALHGGFRPFAGTFLMFSEYARNGIRMAALMRSNPIYVFTHDSIGLGEDGPTHQPVEQLATLRLVPNLDVWRPGDAVETLVAWQTAVAHRHTPTCLVLSRQNLPHQERDMETVDAIKRGGYVLVREDKTRPLQLVLIATGSELDLAVKAQAELAGQGVNARVVSLPSCHVFEQQDAAWKRAVLPPGVPRVAVEAGVTAGWRQYVGLEGAVVGIDTFGESAPAPALYAHFGITVQAVVDAALAVLR